MPKYLVSRHTTGRSGDLRGNKHVRKSYGKLDEEAKMCKRLVRPGVSKQGMEIKETGEAVREAAGHGLIE